MEERAPILANFEDFNQKDNMKDEKHFAVFQINFGDEEYLAYLQNADMLNHA
jgi:hypothetical protein